MEKRLTNESSLVCDLNALDTAQRERHQANTQQLFGSVEQIEELPDGYAFRWPAESATLLKVTDFILLERLCCPFFNFALELEAESGPLWLKMTGRAGVKPFLLAELGVEVG
jgi:hypothetical protein